MYYWYIVLNRRLVAQERYVVNRGQEQEFTQVVLRRFLRDNLRVHGDMVIINRIPNRTGGLIRDGDDYILFEEGNDPRSVSADLYFTIMEDYYRQVRKPMKIHLIAFKARSYHSALQRLRDLDL